MITSSSQAWVIKFVEKKCIVMLESSYELADTKQAYVHSTSGEHTRRHTAHVKFRCRISCVGSKRFCVRILWQKVDCRLSKCLRHHLRHSGSTAVHEKSERIRKKSSEKCQILLEFQNNNNNSSGYLIDEKMNNLGTEVGHKMRVRELCILLLIVCS